MAAALFHEDGITVTHEHIVDKNHSVLLSSVLSVRPYKPMIPGGMHVELLEQSDTKSTYWFSTEVKAVSFITAICGVNPSVKVDGDAGAALVPLIK